MNLNTRNFRTCLPSKKRCGVNKQIITITAVLLFRRLHQFKQRLLFFFVFVVFPPVQPRSTVLSSRSILFGFHRCFVRRKENACNVFSWANENCFFFLDKKHVFFRTKKTACQRLFVCRLIVLRTWLIKLQVIHTEDTKKAE